MTPVATTLQRIVRWSIALLALVPLAPLLLHVDINGAAAGGVIGFYFPYITTGAIVFRIIVEVAFFAWLALAIIQPKFRPDFRKPIVAIMSALTVISILAAVFGVDPIRSIWSNFERMEGLVGWTHLYALFLVVTTTMRERSDWKPFVIVLWSASVLNALLALSVDDSKIDTTVDGRAAGIIGNPIYLAIHMLMSAGIVAWWVATNVSIGRRVSSSLLWSASASIVLFGVAIALSGTRGTFVASAVAMLVAAGVVVLKGKSSPVLRNLAIGLVAAVVIFSATMFAVRDQQWAKENRFIERASSVFNVSGGTIAARFNNWTIALDAIKARPVLGWGQDNYIYPFTYYFNPKMANEEPWFDRTHNQFLDWFVHAGLLGGISYIALIVFVAISIWRMEGVALVERAVLLATIAGYVVHNLFVFDFLVSAMLFVMVLGYIAARSPRFGSGEIEREAQGMTPGAEAEPAAIVLAAVGLTLSLWFIVAPSISGASGMITAVTSPYVEVKQELFEQIIAEGKTGYTEAIEQYVIAAMQVAATAELPQENKDAFVAGADQALSNELARVPNNVRMLMFRGALYSRIGRIDEAVAAFEQMAILAPRRSNNLDMLVDSYLLRGKPEDLIKAREVAMISYELAPDNIDTAIAYAKMLVLDKKLEEADAVLAKYDLFAEGKGNALFSAYQTIGRYDRIAQIMERYLAMKPGDVELTYSLAASYFQAGDKIKAVTTLQSLLSTTTDADLRANVEAIIAAIRAGKNPISN